MKRDDKTELLLSALLHDSLLFFEIVNRIEREIFVENEYNNFMHDLRRFYKQFKTEINQNRDSQQVASIFPVLVTGHK